MSQMQWSVPMQSHIPEINAAHKKFMEELNRISIASDDAFPVRNDDGESPFDAHEETE